VDGAPAGRRWQARVLAVAFGLILFSSADRACAGCGDYVLVEGQSHMAGHPNVPDLPRCPNGECRRGESKPLVPLAPVTFHSVDHWASLFASPDGSPQDRCSRVASSNVTCQSVSSSPRERPPRCA
jgi:hypothetical protein